MFIDKFHVVRTARGTPKLEGIDELQYNSPSIWGLEQTESNEDEYLRVVCGRYHKSYSDNLRIVPLRRHCEQSGGCSEQENQITVT